MKPIDNKKLDKMIGGAIDPKRVVLKNVDPSPEIVENFQQPGRDSTFHNILRDQATLQYEHLGKTLAPMAAALCDYRPRNQVAFFQYASHFQEHPEEDLMSRVEGLYTGNGASKDHHKLHQLFMDSFSHHPELVSLYSNS